ncbi:MAG TPA: carbohydrate-binding domain-containing protein [Pirellulales bacterium]
MRIGLGRKSLMLFAFVAFMAAAMAADEPKQAEKTSKDIPLELKDFKFKLSNPDQRDLFVFNEDEQKLCFYSNGAAEAKFKIPADGDYDLIINASGDSAMNIRPKFKLVLDDKPDDKGLSKENSLKSDDAKDYKFTMALKTGAHKLSIAFTNDTYKEGENHSNFYVHGAKFTPHKPDVAKKAESSENPKAK